MKNFFKAAALIALVIISALVLFALSAALVGYGFMLAVGILANAGVVPATLGFLDSFWIGVIICLFFTGTVSAVKS